MKPCFLYTVRQVNTLIGNRVSIYRGESRPL